MADIMCCFEHLQGDPKSKLLYFVHNFTKYWPIFTLFSSVNSVKNLLLSGRHTAPIMSIHYLQNINI